MRHSNLNLIGIEYFHTQRTNKYRYLRSYSALQIKNFVEKNSLVLTQYYKNNDLFKCVAFSGKRLNQPRGCPLLVGREIKGGMQKCK